MDEKIKTAGKETRPKVVIRVIRNIQSLPEKAKNRIRRKVYAALLAGERKSVVAKRLKLQDRTVGRMYERFKKDGEDAVSGRKTGPKAGTAKHKLSDEQLGRLKKTVADKTPDQLKFAFALWSSKAIKEYVKSEFNVNVSRRTARRYMQRMGFTYQSPVVYAREQQPAQVAEWLEETYPAIKSEAQRMRANILWADEASVLTAETAAKGYSPCGVSPVLRAPANRSIRCNMISAVSNKGELQFKIFEGAMNVDIFKDFMSRLIKDSGQMIFLIVDNLRVHHANCLKGWLEEHRDEIRLFYLPSYSPELNPDEYLNRDVKAAMAEESRPHTKTELHRRIETHLGRRKADPEAVKRLFHKDEVRYASEDGTQN